MSGSPERGGDGLFHLHTDHLGSVSVISKYADGYIRGDTRAFYEPFGAFRLEPSAGLTDRGFTGHRHNNLSGISDVGLIYMNARFYVPGIGRFASADTVVPEPGDPQSFNRYSYVRNNPTNFSDPTGHCRYNEQGEFEYAVDCTVSEFDQLSWDDRILWMNMFMEDTGVKWFSNIVGILEFFRDDPVFSDSDWASYSDAGVLTAIQDGWRIRQELKPIGTGGDEWGVFFKMEAAGESEDTLLQQWGKLRRETVV